VSRTVPTRLYTAAQSRAVDRCAIEQHDLPGPVLMARAARAAFNLLLERFDSPGLLQVLCGPGNNGGDGLLLAVLAAGRGLPVRVFLVDGEPRSEDARAAAARARSAGLALEPFDPAALVDSGVLVDAMLGTGIEGEVREQYRAAITAVNALAAPVLALDVPSGVSSDSGSIAGLAVRADCTISFITAKRGLFTSAGADLAGERLLDDLDVPEAAYAAAGATCELLDLTRELSAVPARPRGAHKGLYGRLLLVGGERGMGGAILLAAEAALRCGVGLARVATRAEHLAPLLARRPECMGSAVAHRNELLPLLDWADAVAVGPGLGQTPWGEQMLQACLAAGKPLLLDADGLNLYAAGAGAALPPGSVITPHPGEAARLLGSEGARIQQDRFLALEQLAQRSGAAVVLKGAGSLVGDSQSLALCTAGNPGMASGGMGDVLSGIIGAFLAQGLGALAAARLGTALHAAAGDRAATAVGERSLLAGDLFAPLQALLR
jgi:hydroxyethylthiazole kinase-like uncharacterized protein yjeF